MIEAKLRGEGIEPEAEEEQAGGNVIDLMAALKRSLKQGEAPARKPPAPAAKLQNVSTISVAMVKLPLSLPLLNAFGPASVVS